MAEAMELMAVSQVRPVSSLRAEVVEAAHVMSRLGLVTAYGHVSVRAGGSMLITPGADLAVVSTSALVEVPLDAEELPTGAPAEAWAHLAVYGARSDAEAIARAQPQTAYAATALTDTLVPVHGQAAWLGEVVPVHDSAHLLRTAERARNAAASLPSGEALLLRGNGALTIGATPGLAVARMWLLAAACSTFLTTAGNPAVRPLTADEIASWRSVAAELLPRLWQHLRTTGGHG